MKPTIKNKKFFSRHNFLVGNLLFLIVAIIGGLIIRQYGWQDWRQTQLNIEADAGATASWLNKRFKKTPDKATKLRLDMGAYQGSPNIDKNYPKYDKILTAVTKANGVDCSLIKALMLAESRGNARANSNRGARGLMQLMPLTARAMGVNGDLFDPQNSILAGVKYFKHLIKTACHEHSSNEVCDTDKDFKYIFAAYNGGSRANDSGLGACATMAAWECPFYDAYFETRVYVNRVKANYDLLLDNGWGC